MIEEHAVDIMVLENAMHEMIVCVLESNLIRKKKQQGLAMHGMIVYVFWSQIFSATKSNRKWEVTYENRIIRNPVQNSAQNLVLGPFILKPKTHIQESTGDNRK